MYGASSDAVIVLAGYIIRLSIMVDTTAIVVDLVFILHQSPNHAFLVELNSLLFVFLLLVQISIITSFAVRRARLQVTEPRLVSVLEEGFPELLALAGEQTIRESIFEDEGVVQVLFWDGQLTSILEQTHCLILLICSVD